MFFYLSLFLIFLYFKLARVHKKEERLTTLVIVQHILVAISTLLLYQYGFAHYALWVIALFTFLFFIIAALMVTAVQVGIFVEGKPLIGIRLLFKLLPLLTGLIIVSLLITLA